MRFKVVVFEHRTVREEWYVDADNPEQAEERYFSGDGTFDSEECVHVSDTEVDSVTNIDDPEGLLTTDEGL